MTIHIGSIIALFGWVSLVDGGAALLAIVDLDTLSDAQLGPFYQAARAAGCTVEEEAPARVGRARRGAGDGAPDPVVVEALKPAAVASPAPRPFPEYPEPVALALTNGWVHDELADAGANGQWGPAGGRSARTGLCMAEMAATIPPTRWADLAAFRYPWECDDWRAPWPDWQVPQVPAKGPPPSSSAGTLSAPLADVAPEPVATVEAEIAAVSSDLPAEWPAIVAELREIWPVDQLEPPTHRKLNFHLQRGGLPPIDKPCYRTALATVRP